MSKIRFEWITGKRLMEKWNLDLRKLNMVIQNGLPVYNPDYELEDRGPIYDETPNPNYDPNDWIPEKYIVEKNNLYDFQLLLETPFPVSYIGLTKDQILSNLLFKREDVENYEREYGSNKDSVPKGNKKAMAKSLRPNQKAKIESREIAERIWNQDPKITIKRMIEHSEIIEVTKKKNGMFYTEKTVRDWIKDLSPNRSPGRPKKNK